ncbi:MAG TPA: gamma-glutamyltransferase [Woeseiaceae bacterium]|nr:gamma-glutamyltransferase [Woeseiaceae bacterium]
MLQSRVATATSSELAAQAAAEIAADGGNAVDCALGAALLTMNTEPGVCALAGGAYVTVWPADGDPVTIDGNVAVPGIGATRDSGSAQAVSMAYGGGIETIVGAPSVAVPGSLAALELASRRYGRAPWRQLVAPSVRAARHGFPLPSACHYYLQYSSEAVFARSADGYRALHGDDGALLPAGSRIVVEHLADTLECIGDEGSRVFYAGELGATIAAHVQAGGGRLTRADLADYRAVPRTPLAVDLDGWRVVVNPPPAIGGGVLAAMLLAFADTPVRHWDTAARRRLIAVQDAVLGFRRERLDLSRDVAADVAALLSTVADGRLPGPWTSASTVHTSAVDDGGTACAVTASSGYGSGEMPPGTGLWLNNCLGELELNRRGLAAAPPGRRLPSNMTPGAARRGDAVLAFGSPGADRITTALHQFLVSYIQQGMPLAEAVAAPRLHLERSPHGPRLAVEPGIELPPLNMAIDHYPAPNMYFGGVAAASYAPAAGFAAAADPRREGATAVSP